MKIDEIVGKALLGEIEAAEAVKIIESCLVVESDLAEKTRGGAAYRLCGCLELEKQGQAGWWDILGHLRQVILCYKRRFVVSEEVAWQVKKQGQKFALSIDDYNEVNAEYGFPDWLERNEQLRELFNFNSRRYKRKVIGDGLLYQMTGHYSYNSPAQKTAIRMAMELEPGHTLLVCLPTGGGKSLVGQLPAWYATGGGQLGGAIERTGSSIVVVPTVALAMDQARAAGAYFGDALGDEYLPSAYWSGMGLEERKAIFSGLANGTMPLVYISPEAILKNPVLNEILLKSASKGKLKNLIIDEAHIVQDWGDAFRPDFQLLAVFRRKLLEASQGKLRTMLFSATIDRATEMLLEEFFSESGKFSSLRGDSLRSEPLFWLKNFESEDERRYKIGQILALLPRPLILYVTKPERAEEWKKLITSKGSRRVWVFTGDTPDKTREELVKAWNEDKIDIMVATSAFSMGVDKADVRSVIHCCLPESLNRFYQEVGRGGRDGYPSLSLLGVVFKEDEQEVRNITNNRVLTDENMVSRWQAMRSEPYKWEDGDSFWTDTDCRRDKLADKITGARNAAYNEITLLFFWRQGWIEILDITTKERNRRVILIKMTELDLLNDINQLTPRIKPYRDAERQQVNDAIYDIKQLVSGSRRLCWGDAIAEVYPYTEPFCNGCPACRRRDRQPDNPESRLQVDYAGGLLNSKSQIFGRLRAIMGDYPEWLLFTDDLISGTEMDESNLMAQLTQYGISNLLIPDQGKSGREHWVKTLATRTDQEHWLFELSEVLGKQYYPLRGPLAVLYPEDSLTANQLFKWTNKYLNADKNNRVVHLASRELFISAHQRAIKDLVEGGTHNAALLLKFDKPDDDFL